MSKGASINDVLLKLQAVAAEHEINLTYTNMMVYLKLIDYAEEHREQDYPVWTRCSVKTLDLADYCSVSPRIVTETLRKLHTCGIIKYVTKRPYPSVVTLYKKFYE